MKSNTTILIDFLQHDILIIAYMDKRLIGEHMEEN